MALAYQPSVTPAWLDAHILSDFGEIAEKSPTFLFSYSSYYEAEMGSPLQKFFVYFKGLYSLENVVETKLKAVELEQTYAENGRRVVNIDPGYITLAKLVLTTTKNYDHRVYLSKGVYADVQLRYRHGSFQINPWTYPDYQDGDNLQFFHRARNYLYELIQCTKAS